jgi:uncharacterized protein (TIGR02145 family)
MTWEPAAQILDQFLMDLGVYEGEQRRLYWKVEPLNYLVPATESLVGTFFLERISNIPPGISLLSPNHDTSIVLNHLLPEDNAVSFRWKAIPGAISYDLILSYKNDLSDPLNIPQTNGITGTSFAFGNDELQTLVQQQILKKRYTDNVLYWNVKETGKSTYLSETPYILKLSGYRQFVDTRGDEVIIYDVSIITYGGKQHVWLSQNLKTEKATDGTAIKDIPVGTYTSNAADRPIGASLDWTYFDKASVEAECGFHTPAIATYIGPYYTTAIPDLWKERIVPAGWKIPTFNEWVELFAAAASISADCRVLKHPEGYPTAYNGSDKLLWNEWNMNVVPGGCPWMSMSPCGGNNSFGYEAENKGVYFYIEDVGESGVLFDKWDTGTPTRWGWRYWGALPMRLIYTGDDNN